VSVRGAVRAILAPLGLRSFGRRLDRKRVEHRYRHVDRWEGEVGGVTLRFATEDGYSKRWFFPRYADGRIHERVVSELLAKRLAGARCFADVGANLGWFTCLAGRLLPAGVVHAFEMDEGNAALARRNAELNGLANVELHRVAVADRSAPVRYERPERGPHPGFRLAAPDAATAAAVSVDAVSLDDFFAARDPKPDTVKIDVEGAELLVLRGMRGLLRAARTELFVEIHPGKMSALGATPGDVVELLRDAGYALSVIEDLRDPSAPAAPRPLSPAETLGTDVMLWGRPEGRAPATPAPQRRAGSA